ncbi:MAG: glycosyltransferase family 4 protein [Anaerolineae bacterium]
MSAQRILFLTPQLPYPPHQGTAIRNWHIIRHVAATRPVDVLSFAADPPAALAAAAPLTALCRRVEALPAPTRTTSRRLADMARGHADMARRLHSDAFAARLAAWLADGYDVVQAEGIEMAPYLLQMAARPDVRRVYDAHNAEALLQQRNFRTDARRPARWVASAYSLVQWRRLTALEKELAERADRVIAVSEADAAALRTLAPGLDPLVVPNGVDTATYDPAAVGPTEAALAGDVPWLVFTGKLDYRPNIEACRWLVEEVMPLVWRDRPDARVALVGRDPAPAVLALAGERVRLSGWVPDTRPYIRDATVYVVPLRVGGGTRLKLLEALAMGCAIVSTTQGAEGVAVEDAALLRDTPQDFAATVVALVNDAARRAALGQAARCLALARYDWSAILPRLDAVYA